MSIHLDAIDRRFGGCAANIAYNLKLLGHDPVPFVFVGRDLDVDYATHLTDLGIDQSGIVRNPSELYSSHAFIFTDTGGNQFTGFYPGPARSPDFEQRLRALLQSGFDYAIIAPDVPANMISAASVLREHGVAFLGDPGQGVTDFEPADCERFVSLTSEMIVNQFEHDTFERWASLETLETLVVTHGVDGASWRSAGVLGKESAVSASSEVDPTGCGDAFRAGWVHAHLAGGSLRDCARSGATVATINLESTGSQAHTLSNYRRRYEDAWHDQPAWM